MLTECGPGNCIHRDIRTVLIRPFTGKVKPLDALRSNRCFEERRRREDGQDGIKESLLTNF